jgi:hypothetical protein
VSISELKADAWTGSKLAIVDKLLQSYYGYVERARPERTSTQSVCNWMDGNKPLISGESSFLSDWDDLCAPSQPSDQGGLDRLLEQCAFLLRRRGYSWVCLISRFIGYG